MLLTSGDTMVNPVGNLPWNRHSVLDIADKNRNDMQIIKRNVKKALNLARMKIKR